METKIINADTGYIEKIDLLDYYNGASVSPAYLGIDDLIKSENGLRVASDAKIKEIKEFMSRINSRAETVN